MSSDRHSITSEDAEDETRRKKIPKSFFDPSWEPLRRQAISRWFGTVVLIFVYVLALLSLYWGALFHVAPYNTSTIPPVVGPAIVKAANMELESGKKTLGWGALPPSHFNYDPLEVRQQIYDQKAWAAIIINANATALLQAAVETGNSSYDPTGAAQVIYVQARDDSTFQNYITPVLDKFQIQVTAMFGEMWAGQVLQQATNTTVLQNLQKAPQAISPAIGFSIFNLRPFGPPIANPSVSVGLIYLLILAFMYYNLSNPVHMKILTADIKPLHFIIWRLFSSITGYLFISLAFSLVSLAMQMPFSNPPGSQIEVVNNPNKFGKATFVVFWMLNWFGMTALGLANENVAALVGQPWMAMWLPFWMITNISISFYNIDLAPAFYRWGWAWPFRQAVDGSRTLIFDTHSRLGLNFGILAAWVAINIALFPLCILARRKLTQRSLRKQREKD